MAVVGARAADELVIAERDCPICKAIGSLIGRGTVAFLPNFLLSFRWYLLVVVQGVVVAHFEQA